MTVPVLFLTSRLKQTRRHCTTRQILLFSYSNLLCYFDLPHKKIEITYRAFKLEFKMKLCRKLCLLIHLYLRLELAFSNTFDAEEWDYDNPGFCGNSGSSSCSTKVSESVYDSFLKLTEWTVFIKLFRWTEFQPHGKIFFAFLLL